MPQMYPMNWILLPLYFILMLLMLFILIYFSFSQPQLKDSSFLKVSELKWMW